MSRKSAARLQKLSVVKTGKIQPQAGKPFLLDLGCGDRKEADHFGIDVAKTSSTDYVTDLTKYPWPIDDGVVDGIYTSHFLEHLSGPDRVPFMNECYRILKVGATMKVIVPFWSSMRAVQDPFHKWPPICEHSFLYFNRGWREQNKLTHGDYAGFQCDFDFGYAHAFDPDVGARADEVRIYAAKHDVNSVMDLHVTLTKRDPNPPKVDGA